MPQAASDHRCVDLVSLVDAFDRGEAITADWIQDRFGIQQPAAYRMMGLLRKVREGRFRAHRVQRRNTLTPLDLPKGDLDRAVALLLASRSLELLRGTEVHRHLVSLLDSERARLRSSGLEALERLEWRVGIPSAGPAITDVHRAGFSHWLDGILNRRVIRMRYRRRDGREDGYEVEPWGLVLKDRLPQLVARKRDAVRPRLFRLERILWSEVTPQAFRPPTRAASDTTQLFARAFGTWLPEDPTGCPVRLLVRDSLARRLHDEPAHPSQRMGAAVDGWTPLEFDVDVCPDLEAWLLGHCPDVRVVGPPCLAARLVQRLRDALEGMADVAI